jgi:hypothetical protein
MRGLAVTLRPQQDRDQPGPAEKAFPLVLELSLAEGDAVRGTVGVGGGSPGTPFHGWIELMSVINTLRADVGETA